ncbi:MAG: methyltransferase family protein [Vicinamibacterales bacterium]
MADRANSVVRTLARRRVPLGFAAAVVTLVLATPTWIAWGMGLGVALAGECIRIWAAGHLEKGREVTRSGPYRFTGHPLYVGSTVIAGGIAMAARSPVVAIMIAIYMGLTIAAAIRTEEAELRQAFGSRYEDYQASRDAPPRRRFSVARARRNREYRSIAGLAAGFALLALKMIVGR